MLLDPRNGPSWDLPRTTAPRAIYVIASTPRTGSTLLCRSLWDTGMVGAPKEYLNPMQIRDWEVRLGGMASSLRHRALSGPALALAGRLGWGEARVTAHLERVMRRRTSATGWFGMKIHAHHHRRWFGTRSMESALGPIRWIRIVRADRLAQAVSWERALQTGRWASHQGSSWSLPPRYSRNAIGRRLRTIERDEAWWDDVLAGEDVLHLTYERLHQARATAVREALRHIRVQGAEAIGVHAASIEKQADSLNLDWMRRYQRGL
ncbi:MAG: hypothetical protein KC912_15605 [Proteobacteria bacterium]|nr:hypothetical protein [Pseudomonadota bacterium]